MDRGIFNTLSREDIEEIVAAYDDACSEMPCSSEFEDILDKTIENIKDLNQWD